jgi:hypothetical protein
VVSPRIDAAQGDIAVIFRHPFGQGDGGRNLQRAGHFDQVDLGPGRTGRGCAGAGDQVVGDVLVIGRDDDQQA